MTPIVLYPVGGGGMWCSNLIHSLHSKNFFVIGSQSNFHDDIWKKTQLFRFLHTVPDKDKFENTHLERFAGPKSQFITFVNSWTKQYSVNESFCLLSPIDQFFSMTNKAKKHLGSDIKFNDLYLHNCTLDLDNLFLHSKQFVSQIYEMLSRHQISYYPNNDFVLESIENFKKTCRVSDHFGNVQSMAWRAWCHALILEHHIPIPMVIRENFDEFVVFIDQNNLQFQTLTNQQFLTHT